MSQKPDTLNAKSGHGALSPFLKMIGHHWPFMALGGALALLATLAAIGLLSLSGWFITATAYAGLNVATAKAFNFFLPSIGVRLFAMIRTGARYGERVIAHDATFRILETLRTWCYGKLEPLAPAGLARHHSGDLLTRITTDIDTLDNLYLRVLSPSLVAVASVALLVAFVGYFNTAIAWFSGALLVVAGCGIPFIAARAARSAARQLNVQAGRLRAILVDTVQGLAALLAYGAHEDHLDKVQKQHLALVGQQRKMSQVTGLTSAAMVLASGLAAAGTLYIGVDALASGTLTGPHLVLLTLAVMAGFEAVAPLPNAYQYLGQTRKAADRLHAVTAIQPPVTFPSSSVPPDQDCTIRFDNVSFQYAPKGPVVLQKINLQISSGQRAAIMGPTGSGKSTLLYLLARFEDPADGQIGLGPHLLPNFSEPALRDQICIVHQKSHIFNGTLKDNLLLAEPAASDEMLAKALSVVQLTDFVAGLPDGLQTWVGEAGRLLSGGQARRLAIARAVLSKARIWAFDEPTEGLDSATARAMMDNLLQWADGKTLIMVTHRPEAIEQMDRVILLDAGRIVAVDSPANLKKHNALYNHLVRNR